MTWKPSRRHLIWDAPAAAGDKRAALLECGMEGYDLLMADRRDAPSRPCPQSVLDLIERFELHADAYRRDSYNETQVRREFIDPLFKSLGWDVDNGSGCAEAYKDVIHEDAIKVGGSTKAPDYCFRIGGVRTFFVEAKKPSVSVGDDPGPGGSRGGLERWLTGIAFMVGSC